MPRLKMGDRSRKGGARGPRGPPGRGFVLTDGEEDCDIEGRRLCNVDDPKEPDDALNLKRAKAMFGEYLSERFVTLASLEGGLENAITRDISDERFDEIERVLKSYLAKEIIPHVEKKIDERFGPPT